MVDEKRKKVLNVAVELDSICADINQAGQSVRDGKVKDKAVALMFEGLEHRVRKAINMVHGLNCD